MSYFTTLNHTVLQILISIIDYTNMFQSISASVPGASNKLAD